MHVISLFVFVVILRLFSSKLLPSSSSSSSRYGLFVCLFFVAVVSLRLELFCCLSCYRYIEKGGSDDDDVCAGEERKEEETVSAQHLSPSCVLLLYACVCGRVG